jgi:hypothetical protein
LRDESIIPEKTISLLKCVRRVFNINKYEGDLKLSPLFLDTAISIFAGLFMFVWGVIFFSNPLYQFSIFMKVRNAFVSDAVADRALDRIYCVGVDPESKLALLDENEEFTNYDLIALSLSSISDYAQKHPDRRIVAGIDYAFAANENSDPFISMRNAIREMPANMFVVFGGLLIRKPETVSTLRISAIEKHLYDPLAEENGDVASRLFLGNIHVAEGDIRNGSDSTDKKAAIGYIPIVTWGESSQKHFFSLPFVMYVVGEVMARNTDGSYDFYTDFGEGMCGFDDKGFLDKLERASGRSVAGLNTQIYYNFLSSKNLSSFKTHFFWLSSVSKRFGEEKSIESYLNMPYINGSREEQVQYFFIAPSETPEFLLAPDEKNDMILTPATGVNEFTYEDEGVLGVTAHAHALSNMRHKQYIDNGPIWLSFLFLLVMISVVFFVSWKSSIQRSLLFTSIVIGLGIALSFVFFCAGVFIPITLPVALSLILFGAVSIGRFVYTTNKNELYEMVAARVFSPKQMEKLKVKKGWSEPRIVRNAVILALFPRKLPDLGSTVEEATMYTSVYDKYLDLVFKAIEKRDGNRITLSMDGVLGFWNIPVAEEGSVAKAYACAKDCVALIPEWQSYIDSAYGRKKQKYFASFDICLHTCECYAGCLGTGNIIDYSISGQGVSKAIESALFLTSDTLNTISLTVDFYKRLIASGINVKGEIDTTAGRESGLYRVREDWKKPGA